MIEKLRRIAEDGNRAESAVLESALLVEVLAGRLREELERRGVGHWKIFNAAELIDVDVIFKEPQSFGEEKLKWEPLSLASESQQPGDLRLTYGDGREEIREHSMGLLLLEASGVAMARWTIWNPTHGLWAHVTMLATDKIERIGPLRRRVAEVERRAEAKEWKVVGSRYEECGSRDSEYGWDQVSIPEPLRERIENEVIGFFSPRARQLYEGLNVPYRRGVLLYGPPGNGKTSIIRVLGAALPEVATMTLQPHAEFDGDDLSRVLRRWVRNAPAMLVIEDIDSIFQNQKIQVSKFLNMLDGITQPCDGGVLLVATTNYPDRLDRGINNRPGRFDVVVEIPAPNRESRQDYFFRLCGDIDSDILERLVSGTDGMSYAHLAEVLRVSGFRAICAGRDSRRQEDWLEALEAVGSGNQAARSGFELSGTEAYGFAAGR